MKRITVTLPDELAAWVDQERRRRDVSAATVIRDAISDQLATPADATPKRFPFVGIGKGDHSDGFSAARMEEFYNRDIAKIARDSGLNWPDEADPTTEEHSGEADLSSRDLVHAGNS